MTDTQPPALDLDAIQARTDAATPGPWNAIPATDADVSELWSEGSDSRLLARIAGRADGEFLAHARTDVPALLNRVREQAARVAELEQQLAAHKAAITAVRALDKHAGEASDDRDDRYQQLDPDEYYSARAVDDTLWYVMHAIDTALAAPARDGR